MPERREPPETLVNLDLRAQQDLKETAASQENVVHLVFPERTDNADLQEALDQPDQKDLPEPQDREESPASAVFADATVARDLPAPRSARLRSWSSAARC